MTPLVSCGHVFLSQQLSTRRWVVETGAGRNTKAGEFGDFSGCNYRNNLLGHKFTAHTLHRRCPFPRS